MKSWLKKNLPPVAMQRLNKLSARRQLLKNFYKDYQRYLEFSATEHIDKPVKIVGRIVWDYHSIEKGLTMPEFRPGFGQPKLRELIDKCVNYIRQFGDNEPQVRNGAGVAFEYLKKHREIGFDLDKSLVAKIEGLQALMANVEATQQIQTTRTAYFAKADASFAEFSESRKSIRNFTDENISEASMLAAIDLAKNAPSACNRQTARTYLIQDKDKIANILSVQNGNRGFGHLSNKLIVVTAELGVFKDSMERNQAFIDGGIFAQNLLYALHANKIGACILNCSHNHDRDKMMARACQSKPSEVFIAIIVCGQPPDNFSIAASHRNALSYYNTII
jgi:nitroreductase